MTRKMIQALKLLVAAAIIGWGGNYLDGGQTWGPFLLWGFVCMGLGMMVLPPYPKGVEARYFFRCKRKKPSREDHQPWG